MKTEFYLKAEKPAFGCEEPRIFEYFDFFISGGKNHPDQGSNTRATEDDRRSYPKRYAEFLEALEHVGKEQAHKIAAAEGEWRPGSVIELLKESKKRKAAEAAAKKAAEDESETEPESTEETTEVENEAA